MGGNLKKKKKEVSSAGGKGYLYFAEISVKLLAFLVILMWLGVISLCSTCFCMHLWNSLTQASAWSHNGVTLEQYKLFYAGVKTLASLSHLHLSFYIKKCGISPKHIPPEDIYLAFKAKVFIILNITVALSLTFIRPCHTIHIGPCIHREKNMGKYTHLWSRPYTFKWKKDFPFTFSSHQNKNVLAVNGAFMTPGKKSLSHLCFNLVVAHCQHAPIKYMYKENKDAFLLAFMRPSTFVVFAFKIFYLHLTF